MVTDFTVHMSKKCVDMVRCPYSITLNCSLKKKLRSMRQNFMHFLKQYQF